MLERHEGWFARVEQSHRNTIRFLAKRVAINHLDEKAPENLAQGIRLQLGLTTTIRPLPEPVAAASPGARAGARLIARIYEADPLRCRRCGGSMQLVACITERRVIVRILDHLGEPTRAPRMAPIRGPPGDLRYDATG